MIIKTAHSLQKTGMCASLSTTRLTVISSPRSICYEMIMRAAAKNNWLESDQVVVVVARLKSKYSTRV